MSAGVATTFLSSLATNVCECALITFRSLPFSCRWGCVTKLSSVLDWMMEAPVLRPALSAGLVYVSRPEGDEHKRLDEREFLELDAARKSDRSIKVERDRSI